MTFDEYTEETKRTAPLLGTDLSDQMHMAIGIVTESSEILDAYKKTFAYGKELDVVNVKEELGDLLWYMSNLIRLLDLDFEEILQLNIKKLRARYEDGFSQREALNRNLAIERQILENDGMN